MELPCIVHKVITRKPNGFAVLAVTLDELSSKYSAEMSKLVKQAVDKKYGTFPVVTSSLDLNEEPAGMRYVFVGELDNKSSYGLRFKANMYYRELPDTQSGMRTFLTMLPNIGEKRAKKIISKFGVQGIVKILDSDDLSSLTSISGITKRMLYGDGETEGIKGAWDRQRAMRHLYEWFAEHGVSVKIGEKAFVQWGLKAKAIVEENPYMLTRLRGVSFVIADNIAHKLTKIDPYKRAVACLIYILNESTYQDSNLCTPYNNAKSKFLELLEKCDNNEGKIFKHSEYSSLFPKIVKENLDLFTAVKHNNENGGTFLYVRQVWDQELFVARELFKRMHSAASIQCLETDINHAETRISKFYKRDIVLDDCQREAIKSSFEHPITIITGGGGTGKSTICRCIYDIAKTKNMWVRMMSPTGKAAQVLSVKTGGQAQTIHRSLGIKPGDTYPNVEIKEHIVLVDEISMSGLDTMFAIMYALQNNPHAHIVFVGDKNQLPSVSPGNFLSDMIQAKCANIVTLNVIHRQDENSYIPLIANAISQGKQAPIPAQASDIKWRDLSADALESDLRALVSKYMESGKNIDDLQIISPMKKGKCGVFAINKNIQEMMAEHNGNTDKFIEIGFNRFYVGDRIMQIENNYEKNVFNGDIGVISSLGERMNKKNGKKERFVKVDFYGKFYDYSDSEFEQLMLAWCITVHKFQGSQCSEIVMVIASEANIMMSKELIYTAFTRAEDYLHIFGHSSIYSLASTRSSVRRRYTNLTKIIQSYISEKPLLKIL